MFKKGRLYRYSPQASTSFVGGVRLEDESPLEIWSVRWNLHTPHALWPGDVFLYIESVPNELFTEISSTRTMRTMPNTCHRILFKDKVYSMYHGGGTWIKFEEIEEEGL